MIISASRRTDIPAYYTDWFFHRLEAGYFCIPNPRNPKAISRVAVNPEVVDGIVFWSKNPELMLDKLSLLSGYPYYFQFTLNPYGLDIEEHLPAKGNIVDTFKKLSAMIGPDRVIWRCDPILITERYSVAWHIQKFHSMACQLRGYTNACVISFLDIYAKNKRALEKRGIRPPDTEEVEEIARAFFCVAKECGLRLDTCAEAIDLEKLGIYHGRCIDADLIERISGYQLEVKKDRNQRPECGCAESIDIGMYDTCPGGCIYCYANRAGRAEKSIALHDKKGLLLTGQMGEDCSITERKLASNR